MTPLPHVVPQGMKALPMNRDPIFHEWAVKLAGSLPRKGFVLEAIHFYHKPDWMVCRWKNPTTGEKRPLPMQWNPDLQPRPFCPPPGYVPTPFFLGKRPAMPPDGFPLYRGWNPWKGTAPLVPGWSATADHPAMALVVEGEWAADWLACLGFPAYTWPNGCQSVDKACFRSLAGFWVTLWPDNDKAGQDAMAKVRGILEALECVVLTVDVDALGLPPKGDAVDWIQRFVQDQGAIELAGIPNGLALAVEAIESFPMIEEWKVAA
jgi:hypothetical protein